MRRSSKGESGETLLEILIAIVIIGIAMSSLFYAFSLSASASTTHQDLVSANGILRGYAEATMSAAKTCPGSMTFTVTYILPPDLVTRGFKVLSSPDLTAGVTCPPTTGPVGSQTSLEHLTAVLPNSEGTKTLDVILRTS